MKNLTTTLIILWVMATCLALDESCHRRVCYYDRMAHLRREEGTRFFPGHINSTLCSHIIYAFVELAGNNIVANSLEEESSANFNGIYKQLTSLKNSNPHVKVLISLGGFSARIEKLSLVIENMSFLEEFVTNTVSFLRKHKFDGLDFLWVYYNTTPVHVRMAVPKMLAILRQAFNAEGVGSDRLLLSVGAYGMALDDALYDVKSISQSVDWINLLAQDFRGQWSNATIHHSPLYLGIDDEGNYAPYYLSRLAWEFVERGAPKEKILLGLPFYGKPYRLISPGVWTGTGAPAFLVTSASNARLPYFKICQLFTKGAILNFISDQRVPYLVWDNLWVGYDDASSLREKVHFIKSHGFGGFVVWSIDSDDFEGNFCGQGRYPLLNAINDECSSKASLKQKSRYY